MDEPRPNKRVRMPSGLLLVALGARRLLSALFLIAALAFLFSDHVQPASHAESALTHLGYTDVRDVKRQWFDKCSGRRWDRRAVWHATVGPADQSERVEVCTSWLEEPELVGPVSP